TAAERAQLGPTPGYSEVLWATRPGGEVSFGFQLHNGGVVPITLTGLALRTFDRGGCHRSEAGWGAARSRIRPDDAVPSGDPRPRRIDAGWADRARGVRSDDPEGRSWRPCRYLRARRSHQPSGPALHGARSTHVADGHGRLAGADRAALPLLR